MKNYLFIIFSLALSFVAQAETVYVTDQLKLDMRSGEGTKFKITKMVASGTPLTVISRNTATGYTKVRLRNGTEGFILTRYTIREPVARQRLEKGIKNLEIIRSVNASLTAELETLKGDNSKTAANNDELTKERDQLSRDFNSLSQTAANAVQLKHQRDQLQERVVNIERENQQLKREKQALEDSANQDWFLYGGILAFAGIFFGLMIPKISWRRKTSSWDTF